MLEIGTCSKKKQEIVVSIALKTDFENNLSGVIG
jgi:hypothetical protein